jgi:hypothetical protein
MHLALSYNATLLLLLVTHVHLGASRQNEFVPAQCPAVAKSDSLGRDVHSRYRGGSQKADAWRDCDYLSTHVSRKINWGVFSFLVSKVLLFLVTKEASAQARGSCS